MRTQRRGRKRKIADAVVRVVATIAFVGALAFLGARQRVRDLTERKPRIEPEPTTVDELVNTASTAGPVTVLLVSPSDRTLN